MPTTAKENREKEIAKKAIVVSKKVKNYEKDPFFVKKAKEMASVLKTHGLPKSVVHA